MEELRVWGLWSAANSQWFMDWDDWDRGWSLDREELQKLLHRFHDGPTSLGMEVREMSELEIAMIPEAVQAVLAVFNMREAKERQVSQ